MPKSRTHIDLMRHGEPVGGRKYRGQQDDPLSEKGWMQMQQSIQKTELDWDTIITSPLSRCQSFAQQLGHKRNIPVICNTQLKEIGMGTWEGKTMDVIKKTDAQAYAMFFKDPIKQRPHGSEALESFYKRVITAWESILEIHPHQNILLIAHAGVLRAIVCHILQAPLASLYKLRFQNAALIRVDFSADSPPMINF